MTGITKLLKTKGGIFAASAVIGMAAGAATYLAIDLAKKRSRKKAYDEALERYSGGENTEWPDIPEGVNVEEVEVEYDDGPKVVVSPIFAKPDLSEMVDYTKFHSKKDDDVEEKTETVEDIAPFVIIDEETYLESTRDYVKADATYFTKDDVLAGWNNDLVAREIETTVGREAVEKFADPSVGSVYVRNESLKVDYEIVRCDDPFEDVQHEAVMEG